MAPPTEVLDSALDLLLQAQRPVILAGHGCLMGRAGDELQRLASLLQIPVATTPQGKGTLTDLPLQAQRPVILAGHGCLMGRAGDELQRLASLLQIPVATTPQGKGTLTD